MSVLVLSLADLYSGYVTLLAKGNGKLKKKSALKEKGEKKV